MLPGAILAFVQLATFGAATMIPSTHPTSPSQPTPSPKLSYPDIIRRLSIRRSHSGRMLIPATTTLHTVLRIMHAIAFENPAIMYNGGMFSPTSELAVGIVFSPRNAHKNFQAVFATWGLYWSVYDLTRPGPRQLFEGSYEIFYESVLVGRVLYRSGKLSSLLDDSMDHLALFEGSEINRLASDLVALPNNAVGIRITRRGSVVSETGLFVALLAAILHLTGFSLLHRMRLFQTAPTGAGLNLLMGDGGRVKFPFVQNAVALDAILILGGLVADGNFEQLSFNITVYGVNVGKGRLAFN